MIEFNVSTPPPTEGSGDILDFLRRVAEGRNGIELAYITPWQARQAVKEIEGLRRTIDLYNGVGINFVKVPPPSDLT